MSALQRLVWHCDRCHYEWLALDPEQPPRMCPNCRAKDWNRSEEPGRAASGLRSAASILPELRRIMRQVSVRLRVAAAKLGPVEDVLIQEAAREMAESAERLEGAVEERLPHA